MSRVFDVIDTCRDILSGTLDLYQSSVSNRLNDIMKVLTILTVMLGYSLSSQVFLDEYLQAGRPADNKGGHLEHRLRRSHSSRIDVHFPPQGLALRILL